jgi:hypothetical protein
VQWLAVLLLTVNPGAIIMGATGSVEGVVDDEYVRICWGSRRVSALHILAPAAPTTAAPIVNAFSCLIRAMGAARFSQVERADRRTKVISDSEVVAAYRAAAAAEADLGMLIEVQGDKLKMEFSTVARLQAAIGRFPTAGTYGVGTKFKLNPPFSILLQPKTGGVWIRCEPESVQLPSGLNLTGEVDVPIAGYVDLRDC